MPPILCLIGALIHGHPHLESKPTRIEITAPPLEVAATVPERIDQLAAPPNLESSLALLRSPSRAADWLGAIVDCESLLLDPATRQSALTRLDEIAHSYVEPANVRYSAIFIIGDAAPEVAKDHLWDLIVPERGKSAIAAILALLIDEHFYSSPELWLCLLTGKHAKLFFDESAVERVEAIDREPGSHARLWDLFRAVATSNEHRREFMSQGWGSDLGPDPLSIRIEGEEFQNRVVDVIAGQRGEQGSDVLWGFLSGASCARMKEVILQANQPAEVSQGAVGWLNDYRFLMDHYGAIPSHEVRMMVLGKFAFVGSPYQDEVLELYKRAFNLEPVSPEASQAMAYGAVQNSNVKLIEYLGALAFHAQDQELRDAIMKGLAFIPRVGVEASYEAFRNLLCHSEKDVRIQALTCLAKIEDPQRMEIFERVASHDTSEEVRKAAQGLVTVQFP
ncbi:MAG TPA: HEAT repeat domain-containing protein [Planctomycetota bacterium]|nr:HEAT repeat domain-containing protein [Planctomycetota bacterium]